VTADGPEALFAESSFGASWKFRRGERILDRQRWHEVAEARFASAPDPERERLEAELIAENIYKEPRKTMLQLIQIPAGCEWAADRWQALLDATRDDDCLETSQHTMICCLLGKPQTAMLDDREFHEFNRAWLGTLLHNQPHLTVDDLMKWYGEHEPAPEVGYRADESKRRLGRIVAYHLPESSPAAAALMRELIGKEIAKLRDRAARLRRERAARAELAVTAAELPATVEAGRRERHVAMMYRRAERGIELALKVRKARLEEEAQQQRASQPVAAQDEGDGRAEQRRAQPHPACGHPLPAGEGRGESGPARPSAPDTSPIQARCAPEENGGRGQDNNPPRSAQPGQGESSVFLVLVALLLLRLVGGPSRGIDSGPHLGRGALLQPAPKPSVTPIAARRARPRMPGRRRRPPPGLRRPKAGSSPATRVAARVSGTATDTAFGGPRSGPIHPSSLIPHPFPVAGTNPSSAQVEGRSCSRAPGL
jgi:hypothetical protein